jgi:hypothetical protein
MKSYVLNFANGQTSEAHFSSDAAAESWAIDTLENHGYDAEEIVSGDWDSNGFNDENQTCERMLFWACEADAENDPGVNAIASLEVIR